MDTKTKTSIENAGVNTRHILIYNDDTLSLKDMEKIAACVKNCPKLESLTISGCHLTVAIINPLIQIIATHPSLSKLDLSKNSFNRATFALPILQQAKKIHTLDLSGNDIKFEGQDYLDFLAAVKRSDTLASLHLPTDPYVSTSLDNSSIVRIVVDCKNLLELRVEGANEDRKNLIHAACAVHGRTAAELLKKLKESKISTVQLATELNAQLPSVVFLAERTETRAEVISMLKDLDRKVLEKFGMSIGIEIYTRAADKEPSLLNETSVSVELPKSQEIALDLPQIDAIVAQLPADLSDGDIRKELVEGRANPMRLMQVGQDLVGAISGISLASLQASTMAMSMEAPVRSMADFLTALTEARQIITDIEQTPQTVIPQVAAPVQRAGWLLRPFQRRGDRHEKPDDSNDKLRTLADAGALARKAGQILQEMIPALTGMEGRLAEKLSTRHKVVDAYQRVGNQLCLICDTGAQVLNEWRSEAEKVAIPSHEIVAEQRNEPFHEQSLRSRTEFLGDIATQVKGHIASHLIHASIEQRQQQGVAGLRGQNLPLLAEQVARFMDQVEMLQRAGVIQSMADVTRNAARTENDTATLAAMQTLSAIENLAGSTRDTLADMSLSAQRIAAKAGVDISASQPALPNPALRSLPAVPPAVG